jgi:hypothetical protein
MFSIHPANGPGRDIRNLISPASRAPHKKAAKPRSHLFVLFYLGSRTIGWVLALNNALLSAHCRIADNP